MYKYTFETPPFQRCPDGYFYGASGMELTVNELSRFLPDQPVGTGYCSFTADCPAFSLFRTCNGKLSEENRLFFEKWEKENPGKNKYTDYFEALFQDSFQANPEFQNQGGSFLEWRLPGSGLRTVLFSSGMGDGIYSGYWGLDAEGEIACLVVLFLNPAYF